MSALARYNRWVDARTGPTGRERTIGGGSASNGGNERIAALNATDASLASPDFDAAIKTFAAAEDILVPILNEAQGYHACKDYKLDNGRAFHARIVVAGPPLLATRRHLEDVIAVEKRHLDLITLDTIEAKAGSNSNWNILSFTTRSKQVVDRFADVRAPTSTWRRSIPTWRLWGPR